MSTTQQTQTANQEKARLKSSYLPDPAVFKKGSVRTSSIHEEPTLLSFFFLFHFDDQTGDSPLFAPASQTNGIPNTSALNFFENTLNNSAPEYAKRKAAQLNSFIKVLRKVNTEMPWFFQSVTGLELARQYNPEEPFRGADKPKIEIECLEENIELTATTLMSLYRNAVWDEKRHVRVLPSNVSKFTVDVYVTEVRSFQANTGSPLLGSNRGSTAYTNLSNQDQDNRNADKEYATGFLQDDFGSGITPGRTKPVFAVRLKQCEFDINSGQEAFADLSKNPEVKKPRIGIFYKVAEVLHENGGPNLPLDATLKEIEIISKGEPFLNRNPFDPQDDKPKVIQALSNAGKDIANRVGDAIAGVGARIKNLSKVTTGNSTIGNAYGVRFTGALGNVINSFDIGSLFLGNVHGLSGLNTLQDAINSASINALGLFRRPQPSRPSSSDNMSPENIYDNLNVGGGLGGARLGNTISPKNIYDGINLATLDSTPDTGIR